MAKVDLKITVHLKGEKPNYREMSIEDMDYSLDEIITALIPDNDIKYQAKMEDFVSGVTVEKSK